MMPVRVLVVDDHVLFRRGLVEVLAEEPDVEIIGEAVDGNDAIAKAGELAPDVVFMDLTMPGVGGIEATAFIRQTWPQIKVVILTVSEELELLFKALAMGANGYVVKTASPREIVDAMRQVCQGWMVLSPGVATKYLAHARQAAPGSPGRSDDEKAAEDLTWQLTAREREVLSLVARGMSNVEVSKALMVSENTVKTHVKNVLGKLQTSSRREAAALASKLGLVKPGAEGF
ncbi:MAG: response regulator transcription factor [Chloroflexi bacterium]|nr:response regulator transcription factor [Chloroflexota bacterium]